MFEIRTAKASEVFPFVSELLAEGKSARITVTGTSMYPFLREGIDSVEFSAVEFPGIKRGDIVLIRRDTGQFIMHRVLYKKPDCFYMAGDAQQWVEGPLRPEQLVAGATAIWRRDRKISCSKLHLKLLASLWLYLLPFRHIIFGVYSRIRKVRRT